VLLAHRWPAIRPAVLCISGMVASFIAVAFVNFKFFTVCRHPECLQAGQLTGFFMAATPGSHFSILENVTI